MRNLITLKGNVHPLAQPQFDQGVAPDDLPISACCWFAARADQKRLAPLLDQQQCSPPLSFIVADAGQFGSNLAC